MISRPAKGRFIAAVMCLFVVSYTFANPFFLDRIKEISTLPNKAVFFLVHAIAIICLLAAAVSSKRIFYAFGIISFLSILLDNSFFFVKHYAITLGDLSVLFGAAGYAPDAILQFRDDFLKALGTALLLILCLVLLRRVIPHWRHAGRLVLLLIGISFCFYLTVAVFRGEPALIGLPSNYTLLFGGPVLALDKIVQDFRPINPVIAKREAVPFIQAPEHIVLIIDESVEGEKFREFNSQPFVNAIDFGLAFSGANCSAASNLILRVGPSDLSLSSTILGTQPLFELARVAGFQTAFLDLQGVLSDSAVHDYFTNHELAAVDEVYPPDAFGGKRFERDLNFANRFSNILSTKEKFFAIVNKSGSHFPYAADLPPGMADTGNAYRASVSFSTVGFLHKIDSTLPASTIVFYTSDHGQNFVAKSPHCNGASDSTLSEWRVPLIVFLSKDLTSLRGMLNPAWDDRASHFELAETIRVLLGYDRLFNKTLFDPPGDLSKPYRAYFGPIKGFLGRPASFREFDRTALTTAK